MTSSNLAPTPSEESIQFDRFEIFSNENSGQSIDLRGGAPSLEYRESVFMPYVDISAGIIDTGEVIDADDGSGSSINLLESIKCQGTEKIKFKMNVQIFHDNIIFFEIMYDTNYLYDEFYKEDKQTDPTTDSKVVRTIYGLQRNYVPDDDKVDKYLRDSVIVTVNTRNIGGDLFR